MMCLRCVLVPGNMTYDDNYDHDHPDHDDGDDNYDDDDYDGDDNDDSLLKTS